MASVALRADDNGTGADEHRLRCLVIEDNSFDRRMIRAAARGCSVNLELVEGATLAEARELIETNEPDLIILDWRLPDGDGLDLTREVATNAELSRIPVIMLSNSEGEEIAVEAMRAGATDYLVKRRLTSDSLQRAVNLALNDSARRTRSENGIDTSQLLKTLDQMAELKRDVLRILSQSWSMIDAGTPLEKADRQTLSTITRRAIAGVDDMTIDLATAYDTSPPERIDTIEMLRETLEEMRELIEVRGAEVRARRMPTLNAVPSHLRLILEQLVLHGLRFARIGLSPEIEFGGSATQNGETIFWYRDRGLNLAARLQADRRVLDGTGASPEEDALPASFGLSLCQRAVERNGGRFAIFGEEDGGCRIVMRFGATTS